MMTRWHLKPILASLACAGAIALGTPAAAQVYKWVDERGVVNYSSQPPAASETKSAVEAVEDRISVYSPDADLVREMTRERESAQRPSGPAPAEPEHPAVVMLGGAGASPPPPVEESYAVYYPVAFPHRHRSPFPPTRYFLPKPDRVKTPPPAKLALPPAAAARNAAAPLGAAATGRRWRDEPFRR